MHDATPPLTRAPFFVLKATGRQIYGAFFKSVVILREQRRQRLSDAAGEMTEEEKARRATERKEIEEFKGILHRIMECNSTPEDYLYLRRHNENMRSDGVSRRGAVRLCARNKDKDECNLDALADLGATTGTPIVRIEAMHTGPVEAVETKAEDAGNLQRVLYLAKGAKVTCTWNGWKEAGLINGASGTVHEIIYSSGDGPPGLPVAILVQMDAPGYRGPSFLKDTPRVVKFIPMKHDFEVGNKDTGKKRCSRTQFPLAPGYANSIHKAQGQTLDGVVGNLGDREFNAGLMYVLFSRVRRLRDITLDPFPGPKRFFNNKDTIRDRQAHERDLEAMYRRVIQVELARSKDVLLGDSAVGNVARMDAIGRIIGGSESVYIPWGWKTVVVSRRGAPPVEYVAEGGIISVRDALKTAALSYKASRRAQELRRAQKARPSNKLLRQYQVDRLRKVASNELADSEARGAAASTLEEHAAYLESVHAEHRVMAQALKSSTADRKLRETEERNRNKSIVDNMHSAQARAEKEGGPKARARDSETHTRPSTTKPAPDVHATKKRTQAADIRYTMPTPQDLFHMPPSSTWFHEHMQHVFASSGLPIFPGYNIPSGVRLTRERTTDTSSLTMRMRLVDYLESNRNSALWASLESWARGFGFEVRRDHSATQIGAACGIVAARVVTWLKASENFMEHDTSGAVSSDIIRTANTELLCLLSLTQDGGIPSDMYTQCCIPGADGVVPATAEQTYSLTDWDTGDVASLFHGSPARITGNEDRQGNGFLLITTIDETIKLIADAVSKASTGDASAYGKTYFITNDQPTGKPGYHWATIVISIQPRDDPVRRETVANNTSASNLTNYDPPPRRATNTRLSFNAEKSF